MLLQTYIENTIRAIINQSSDICDIEFDIGITPYEYEDTKAIIVMDESKNRVKFTINISPEENE